MDVGLYARISEDRSGEAVKVETQLADGRRLAAARGWTVVGEYADNDISALTGARRPGYQQLLADIEAGRIQRLIVFQTSRLWRNRRERADGMEIFKKHAVSIVAVKGPELDLSNAYGRMIAGVIGEFDTAESEVKGERVARAARRRAELGMHHGGQRCFGYGPVVGLTDHGDRTSSRSGDVTPCPDGITWCVGHKPVRDHYQLVQDEADEIAKVATALLAGVPLGRLVTDLNKRGVTTTTGKAWHPLTLRDLLMRPRLAGLAEYQGQIVGKGKWPAIITEDQHYALVALLTDPARRTTTGNRAAYLLSGIATCGTCGSSITSFGVKRARVLKSGEPAKLRYLYRCRLKACVAVARDWADDWVVSHVVSRLAQADAEELLVDDDRPDTAALADEAHAIRVQMDDAAASFARRAIDRRQLEIITSELNKRLDEIRLSQQHTSRAPVLQEIVEAGAHAGAELAERKRAIRDVWSRMSLDRQRAVVQCLFSITVHKGGSGRKTFDSTKVRIVKI